MELIGILKSLDIDTTDIAVKQKKNLIFFETKDISGSAEIIDKFYKIVLKSGVVYTNYNKGEKPLTNNIKPEKIETSVVKKEETKIVKTEVINKNSTIKKAEVVIDNNHKDEEITLTEKILNDFGYRDIAKIYSKFFKFKVGSSKDVLVKQLIGTKANLKNIFSK